MAPVRIAIAIAFTIAALSMLPFVGALVETAPALTQPRPAPSGDPRTFRRLEFDHLRYAGAFRLPATESEGPSFNYGGKSLALNPERNSLFVAGGNEIAEVTIPELVSSRNIDDLRFADYLQPFADPTEGRLKEVADSGAQLAGLLVHDGRLFGSALIYYDANNTQAVSHFSRSLSLLTPSATPIQRIGDRGRAGFVAGYMATVPPEWRVLLGGPALTGQCCVPIASRTSYGPAAAAWDPAELLKGKAADAISLVHYDSNHQTLGPWSGSNGTYGGTTMIGGLAVINGTRTALFIGANGTGPFCYGNSTEDKRLAGGTSPDGEHLCYDPATPDKGQHAYPYRYQMWAYDLNDWAAVKAGKRDPWEVVPYGVWPFDLPFPERSTRIGGVTYDPVRRMLYFAQLKADQGGYAYRPLIHAYYIP
jgi:hypothetical protein